MPVVKVRIDLLKELTGIRDVDELRDILFKLKCETEIEEGNVLSIEVQSDRIDMFSVEGIARAVRVYKGIDKPVKIKLKSIPFKVLVHPPTKRPYIAVAAVTNVKLDNEKLKLLIEFQERLHTTFGRNRRKVAIGLHDLEKLPSPTLEYREVDIDKATMIPLHSCRRMSVREVLELTEQGKLYGSISLNGSMHPAILSGGEIISLHPVINSDITRLTEETRNILIDITGTDFWAVNSVLNALIHALTFYGGDVLGAEIVYPDKAVLTPNLNPLTMGIDLNYVSSWLGIEKDVNKISSALERMGYNVIGLNGDTLVVEVPYYRADILHQVDVVEDIAIGIGYDELGFITVEPKFLTKKGIEIDDVAEIVREILVGLGWKCVCGNLR